MATEVAQAFPTAYSAALVGGMRAKLGLRNDSTKP